MTSDLFKSWENITEFFVCVLNILPSSDVILPRGRFNALRTFPDVIMAFYLGAGTESYSSLRVESENTNLNVMPPVRRQSLAPGFMLSTVYTSRRESRRLSDMSDGTNDLNFLEVSSKLMEAAAKSEHKINRLFACFAWMTRLWQRLRQSGGVLGKKGREVVRVAK